MYMMIREPSRALYSCGGLISTTLPGKAGIGRDQAIRKGSLTAETKPCPSTRPSAYPGLSSSKLFLTSK